MNRGTGSVYKPVNRGKVSAFWWIRYWVRAKQYRENTQTARKSEALAMLDERRTKARRGELPGGTFERTGFEDLAKLVVSDYTKEGRKSLDRALRSLARLRKSFGRDLALSITPARVENYIAARLAAGAARATVRLELAALGRMFTLGERFSLVARRPRFPSVAVENARHGFFEDADFRRVLTHLADELRPLVSFMFWTGWRLSEVKSLEWRQVDFGAGVVRLEPGSTKNGEGREFPFGVLPELAGMLREQRQRTDALQRERGRIVQHVFHRDGEPIRDLYAAWRSACRLAGVPGRLMHDFRRTAVRRLERSGVSRSVAMKLTGHKTESIYRRYAIVAGADLAEGVRRVAAQAKIEAQVEATGMHPACSDDFAETRSSLGSRK